MTIRIPKPVAIIVGVLAAIALGVVGTLAATGGSNDHQETTTATHSAEAFTATDLKGVDSADTSLDNDFHHLADALDACAGGNTEIILCFDQKYSAYFASISGVEAALDESQSKGTGECGIRLGEVRPALAIFKSASQDFKQHFDAHDFAGASEGAWVGKYQAYRAAMDKALTACANEVPGAEATPAG